MPIMNYELSKQPQDANIDLQKSMFRVPVPVGKVNTGDYNIIFQRDNIGGDGVHTLPQESIMGIQQALKVLEVAKKKGDLDENEQPSQSASDMARNAIDMALKVRQKALDKGHLELAGADPELAKIQRYAEDNIGARTFGIGNKVMPYLLAGMAKAGQAVGALPEDPNTLQNMQKAYNLTPAEKAATNKYGAAGTITGYADPLGGFNAILNGIKGAITTAQVAKMFGIGAEEANNLIKTVKGLKGAGYETSPALASEIPTVMGRTALMGATNATYEVAKGLGEGKSPKELIDKFGDDVFNGAVANLMGEGLQLGGMALFSGPKDALKESKTFLSKAYASARGDIAPTSVRMYANPATRKEIESGISTGLINKAKEYTDNINEILRSYEDDIHNGIKSILKQSPQKEISTKPLIDSINAQIQSLESMGKDASGGRDFAINKLKHLRDSIYSTKLEVGGKSTGIMFDKIPTSLITQKKRDIYSLGENYFKETGQKLPDAVDKEASKLGTKLREMEINAGKDIKGKDILYKGKNIEQLNQEFSDEIQAKKILDINSLMYGGPSRLGWMPEKFARTSLRSGKRGVKPVNEASAAEFIDTATKDRLGESTDILNKAKTIRAIHDFTNPEVISGWYTGRSKFGSVMSGSLGALMGALMGDKYAGMIIGGSAGSLLGGTAMAPALTKPYLEGAGAINSILEPSFNVWSKATPYSTYFISRTKGGLIPEAKNRLEYLKGKLP